jgi:hypothetical protein
MNHIIDDCPIHAFEDGLLSLHEATSEAIQYLSDLNIDCDTFKNKLLILSYHTINNK